MRLTGKDIQYNNIGVFEIVYKNVKQLQQIIKSTIQT